MWSKTRLTAYVTAAFGAIAALAAVLGLADYNPVTQMIDPKPFSLVALVGFVAPIVTTVVAAVANVFGWKSKP